MVYNSFYGLTFNPFDKQQLREKDCFRSRDFNEMNVRLNHLKNIRGIGVFTALANVKHFFTSLGKIFFTPYGKEFFTSFGKQIFTLYGKEFWTLHGNHFFTLYLMLGI
jgi:hypothetical protein